MFDVQNKMNVITKQKSAVPSSCRGTTVNISGHRNKISRPALCVCCVVVVVYRSKACYVCIHLVESILCAVNWMSIFTVRERGTLLGQWCIECSQPASKNLKAIQTGWTDDVRTVPCQLTRQLYLFIQQLIPVGTVNSQMDLQNVQRYSAILVNGPSAMIC